MWSFKNIGRSLAMLLLVSVICSAWLGNVHADARKSESFMLASGDFIPPNVTPLILAPAIPPAPSAPIAPSPGLGGIGHQVDPGRLLDEQRCSDVERKRAKKGQRCYVRRKAPSKNSATKKAKPPRRDNSTRKARRDNNRNAQALPHNEPNEVLAVFGAQVTDQVISDVATQYGLTRIADTLIEAISARVVRYSVSGGQTLADAIVALEADARVNSAQFNYVYQTSGSRKHGYPARLLNLGEAHALASGKDVVVAVIDTAVDTNHPALKAAIQSSFDAIGEKQARPDPHGTVIAGIIAGQAKLTGVAPGAKLLAIRAFQLSKDGRFRTSNSFTLLKSVDWAQANGAHVLNLSFAGPHDRLFERLLTAVSEKGVISVASVGNEGPKAKPAYPAAYQSAIAVTAVDANKTLFPQAIRGAHVAMAAPGVRILSAKPNGKYGFLTGTSMAAAHVSGVVALMLEKSRGMEIQELLKHLTETASDLGAPGKDAVYGSGLVDAHSALKSIEASKPGAPEISKLKAQ